MTSGHSLIIDPDQQLRIEALAIEQTRSPEFVLRDAVDEYLARQDAERTVQLSPEELIELRSALEDFAQTGLHVTWDGVDAWLSRIEAGERVTPPECHR